MSPKRDFGRLRRKFGVGTWCVHFWYAMKLDNFGVGAIFEAVAEKDGQGRGNSIDSGRVSATFWATFWTVFWPY